ncbi:MAG: hypothetical protein H6606_10500 [Flavobacteriales bacterium]|nr:hypothetical protein [Flavobacteriales bacterium]
MRSKLILFFTIFSFFNAPAQNVPMGGWRIHLPYNAVFSIAEGPERLYIGAERGFYSFHKKSGEIELYSKVTGFSDVEVSKLAWHNDLNLLFIAYANTNIDILKSNGVIVNISAIKRESILGIKRINDIHFQGNLAYLSCSFGIVVVDLVKNEIKDNYLNIGPGATSINIESVAFYGDHIYAATQFGLMRAHLDDQDSWQDFNKWSFVRTASYTDHLKVFNNEMYAVMDSVLEVFDGSNWRFFEGNVRRVTVSLDVNHDHLVVAQHKQITVVDQSGNRRVLPENIINYALLDYEGFVWTGGRFTGLMRIDKAGQYSFLTPNGPFGPTSFSMASSGSQIWVAGGTPTGSWQPTFNNLGYYWYDGEKWTNRLRRDEVDRLYDFVSVAVSNSGDAFVGSMGEGILHLKHGQFVAVYDEMNTPLSRDNTFTGITGLALDESNNLWVSNYESQAPLKVRTPQNQWFSYTLPVNGIGELVVDKFGQKWIAAVNEPNTGICVFKEEDGLGGSNQRVRLLDNSPRTGGLPSNIVKSLAVDHDGRIWVGTEEGLAVFFNPRDVFEGGEIADAQQIIIDDGKDVGFLLGNEVINDIAVDGANRKWIATNTGAWLVAADGSGVVRHFTETNSPLLSNSVQCLAIDLPNGEVFFGTDKGIISYRDDATAAGDKHGDVIVFPNPVRPNYDGPITIQGLPANATVKITDVAGRVVYEMVANGGTAVWEGRNFEGKRPATGIYLIFSANEEDEDALVSKLLIVK